MRTVNSSFHGSCWHFRLRQVYRSLLIIYHLISFNSRCQHALVRRSKPEAGGVSAAVLGDRRSTTTTDVPTSPKPGFPWIAHDLGARGEWQGLIIFGSC